MSCLIYSAVLLIFVSDVLLLSIYDDLGCSKIDYAAIEQVIGLMNVP